MTNLIVRNLTPYNREDLVSFTRDSSDMKFDRESWGKNKGIVCSVGDKLSSTDGAFENVYDVKKEKFSTKERYTRKPTVSAHESLQISDNYRRSIYNTQSDTFTISDRAWSGLSFKSRESFGVIDQDERLPNTVLYDVEIDNGVLLEEDAEKYISSGTPLNYSEVRPLYAGEYEYKNAVVGIQFSITPAEGRFGIIGSTLNIDIEDTVAKGQSFVPSSGAEIKFIQCVPAKHFYTVPQILTSLVEASEPCSVEIAEISRLGFKVKLKSNSTGLYVDGTINWLADGY